MDLNRTFSDFQENAQWVSFRIVDLFHPRPEDVLASITPDLLVRGKIVSFSDAGRNRSAYAVIEVEGISQTMVVPVSKLQWLTEKESGD